MRALAVGRRRRTDAIVHHVVVQQARAVDQLAGGGHVLERLARRAGGLSEQEGQRRRMRLPPASRHSAREASARTPPYVPPTRPQAAFDGLHALLGEGPCGCPFSKVQDALKLCEP
jgi:hypothetical protein